MVPSRIATTAACAFVFACGGSPSAAPRGTFVYHDTRCGPFPDGGLSCQEVGDGGVMALCQSSAQCVPDAPYCRTLGLYLGGDYSCNGHVLVCRAVDRNDCPLSTR